MWAIVIMAVLVALGMVALAAQPLTPAITDVTAAALALEPAWMLLSGAALIVLAGIVRRLTH